MKTFLRFGILLAFLLPALAHGQWAALTASNIQDVSGAQLASGQICVQAVDNANHPIGARVGTGSGQAVGVGCASIVNGAIAANVNAVSGTHTGCASGSFCVPDTSQTAPLNVCLRVTIKNADGVNIAPPGYTCLQPSSSQTWCASSGGNLTCNLDQYPPNLTAMAVNQTGAQGPQGPAGTDGITDLTGDVRATGPGTAAATLATVNPAPGTCGDATHVCQVTTDIKGRTTAQSEVPINVSSSGTVTDGTGTAIANQIATSTPTTHQIQYSTALPNGTTATTQTTGDNTAKVATDAFVLANAGGTSAMSILSPDKPSGTISTTTLKNFSLASGATADVLPTVTGSGYVSELVLFTGKVPLQITVTVDGEATPSIQMPLSQLLGDAYMDSQATFANNWISGSNAGIGNLGGAFRLPIPFASSIHITMTNNSGATSLITGYVVVHTGVADTWNITQHLYAVAVKVSGIAANTETNMVNVTPGKAWRLAGFGWIYDGFPGTVTPRPAPLEGAFKVYQDSASANLVTSGSEDEFGLGWYFNHANVFGNASADIIAPLGGDMSCTIGCTSSTSNNTWGAQRFFIHDPITGTSSLKMSWTCGNTSAATFTGTCELWSTVWYYTVN